MVLSLIFCRLFEFLEENNSVDVLLNWVFVHKVVAKKC